MYKQLYSSLDKQKALELIDKYGTNSISYIILEENMKYFFSKQVQGVIGYKLINNVVVVAGDPICSKDLVFEFLSEFKEFCKHNSFSICFCQISDSSLKLFKNLGFGIQEYGKEAVISLNEYSITGSKAAKIRWCNNKMTKLGIIVREYKPLIEFDKDIEFEIESISKDWLKIKKMRELSFTLGSISLDNPMDKRYFIATDSSNIILGFIVCFPYKAKSGYFVDVTRRRPDAPLGIMEKIIVDTCEMLKAEGVKELSLGLAPLADIEYEKNMFSIIFYKVFKFIYNNMNSFYGYKSLFDYKKKYNPTIWESRFIAVFPKIYSLKIIHAMLKAKNPEIIREIISIKFNSLMNAKVN